MKISKIINLNYTTEKTGRDRIIAHAMFWLVYLFLITCIYGNYDNNYTKVLIISSILLPLRMFISYFTVYYLIPEFLLKRREFAFLGLFAVSAILFGLAQRVVYMYAIYPLYYPECINEIFFHKANILAGLLKSYGVTAVMASFKYLKKWLQNEQRTQQLEKQQLEAELSLLKAQIDPHFLFNTLNNLYSLTLKKSDKAPEMILKLSELLNFMLYETNAKSIPVQREISLISDYLKLEELRYGTRLQLKFETSPDFGDLRIAPMLLLPLVENGFKHGTSNVEKIPWININISVNEQHLSLHIENNIEAAATSAASDTPKSDYRRGVGLKNVKRRLELIYPNKHNLIVKTQTDMFAVFLTINLS